MVGRALRNVAAARTSPRLLAAASRLAHGESGPQRWVRRRFAASPANSVEVTTFSALETLDLNRRTARALLDRAGVPYDAPEPPVMHRAQIVVGSDDAPAARSALASGPPGLHVTESAAGELRVWTRQVVGDLQLAGPDLGCDVRLDGRTGTEAGDPPIPFPVDAVYTWVDGSDPAWRERQRAAQTSSADGSRHTLSANVSRYASREELRYSLRSLEMYAGWVRHVYLVTDAQVPPWLRTDHPKVTVVDHREIFPADGAGLPTFNSHAIEARLHHVPGLADHYLYLNDDVFFGRPVAPELFFVADGSTRFFRTPADLTDVAASAGDRPVDAAAKTSRDLIRRDFGQTLAWKYQHVAHPQRRDVMDDMESRYRAELDRTVRSPFRSPDDVSAAASLAHAYGFVTGRSVAGHLTYVYCDIAERRAPIKLTRLARHRDADMFCLNDVGDPTRAAHDPERLLADFLRGYFPLPSSFEVAV
ncbi:MAG: stealth family protein [Actinomycetales bacterium]